MISIAVCCGANSNEPGVILQHSHECKCSTYVHLMGRKQCRDLLAVSHWRNIISKLTKGGQKHTWWVEAVHAATKVVASFDNNLPGERITNKIYI